MSDGTGQPALTQIGAYDIVSRLGAGGMGVVYEARHRDIGRRVAIKLLASEHARDEDSLRRFFNEARAVNLIEHPSLVQISDYGQSPDGAPYLVMEFLSGQTLRHRLDSALQSGQLLPLRLSLSLGQQVADALAAAHEKGVIHRDLKPENLMLVADPVAPSGERVKILDFGIAKVQAVGGKKTTTGTVIGTPLYMSPEQCSGADETTDRSDVYSLGVILYELLSGRPPFDAEGAGRIVAQHLFHAPPALAQRVVGLPSEVAAFVRDLLHKDKQRRPSMREVSATLAGYLGRLPAALLDRSPQPIAADRASRSDEPGSLIGRPAGSEATTRRSRFGPRFPRLWVSAATLGTVLLLAVLIWRGQRRAPSSLPLDRPKTSVTASADMSPASAAETSDRTATVPGHPEAGNAQLVAAPGLAQPLLPKPSPGAPGKPSPGRGKPGRRPGGPAKPIAYEP